MRRVVPGLLLLVLASVGPSMPAAFHLEAARPLPRPTHSTPDGEESPSVARVALSELRREPGRRLAERVALVVQLRELSTEWEPFTTRFGPRQWLGASAWGDEQWLWRHREFADPCPTLFARLGSPAAAVLRGARPYERLEVVGTVREVLLGEPWIEIESVQPTLEQVGEGTIVHAERAVGCMERGEWQMALDSLARASVPRLPLHAATELERLAAECRFHLQPPPEKR